MQKTPQRFGGSAHYPPTVLKVRNAPQSLHIVRGSLLNAKSGGIFENIPFWRGFLVIWTPLAPQLHFYSHILVKNMVLNIQNTTMSQKDESNGWKSYKKKEKNLENQLLHEQIYENARYTHHNPHLQLLWLSFCNLKFKFIMIWDDECSLIFGVFKVKLYTNPLIN